MNSKISKQKLDHSIAGYICRSGDSYVVVRDGKVTSTSGLHLTDDAIHSQSMMEAIRQHDYFLDRHEKWVAFYADPRLNGTTWTVMDVTDDHYLRIGKGREAQRSPELSLNMLLHSGQKSALISHSYGKRNDRIFSRLVARVTPLMDYKCRTRVADYAGEVRNWSSVLQVEYEDGSQPTVVFAMKEHGSRAEALASVEQEMKPRYPGLKVEEHKLKFGHRPEHEMEITYAPA